MRQVMTEQSVQAAHDALLAAMPAGAEHHCHLCPSETASVSPGATTEEAGQVDERTFTESQHAALVEAAVARETTGLTTANDALKAEKSALDEKVGSLSSELAAAQSRIDILEAEKASALQAREALAQEFETFKTGLTELAQIASRTTDRVARVKAAAGTTLAEDYFTDESRIARWAQLADEEFETFVASLTEVAKAAPGNGDVTRQVRETAAFKGGQSATTVTSSRASRAFVSAIRPGVAALLDEEKVS